MKFQHREAVADPAQFMGTFGHTLVHPDEHLSALAYSEFLLAVSLPIYFHLYIYVGQYHDSNRQKTKTVPSFQFRIFLSSLSFFSSFFVE